MGKYTTEMDVIQAIESLMDSEGTTEQAEKFYQYCVENDLVKIEWDGFYIDLEEMPSDEFFDIWNKIME